MYQPEIGYYLLKYRPYPKNKGTHVFFYRVEELCHTATSAGHRCSVINLYKTEAKTFAEVVMC
jgi:hypothetical protein